MLRLILVMTIAAIPLPAKHVRSPSVVLGFMPLVTAVFGKPVEGQFIRGRLIDAETGRPVPVGNVTLLEETSFRSVATEVVGSDGQFWFLVPRAIREVLVASQAMGYRSYLAGPFVVEVHDTLTIELRVPPMPIPLDSLAVVVGGTETPLLRRVGFYRRKAIELAAVFLERRDIESRQAFRASDVFRRIPGVHVVPFGTLGQSRILLRNRCAPVVYLDGVRVASAVGQTRIDDLVLPTEIEGIEIYRSPSQVPLRWGGTGARCGVVVIWTR